MGKWDFFQVIGDDEFYNSMQKQLEKLKDIVFLNKLSNFEKIVACEKALVLATKICEYSKVKGYDLYYKEIFGSSKDEYQLNSITELLEHTKIYALYEEACSLEKGNLVELALEKYFEILNNYIPSGSLYYERPAIILEKLKRYDEAIIICDKAIKAIEEKRFNCSVDTFLNRKERLLKKLSK